MITSYARSREPAVTEVNIVMFHPVAVREPFRLQKTDAHRIDIDTNSSFYSLRKLRANMEIHDRGGCRKFLMGRANYIDVILGGPGSCSPVKILKS